MEPIGDFLLESKLLLIGSNPPIESLVKKVKNTLTLDLRRFSFVENKIPDLIIPELFAGTSIKVYKNINQIINLKVAKTKSLEIMGLNNSDRIDIDLVSSLTISNYGLINSERTKQLNIKIKCNTVKEIRIENMNLNEFPKFIFANNNLKKLNFKHNQLYSVTPQILNLRSLQSIDLSFNSLDVFPEILLGLPKLSKVKLTGNSISKIPNSLTENQIIEELDLSSNHILDIPRSIECLQALKNLNLSNNFIENITIDTTFLLNLSQLNLKNNPLKYSTVNLEEYPQIQFSSFQKKLKHPNLLNKHISAESKLLEPLKLDSIHDNTIHATNSVYKKYSEGLDPNNFIRDTEKFTKLKKKF